MVTSVALYSIMKQKWLNLITMKLIITHHHITIVSNSKTGMIASSVSYLCFLLSLTFLVICVNQQQMARVYVFACHNVFPH